MAVVSGVYAAAITPRREGAEIDLAAVFEMIDFLGRGGVDGIALMGSTGEFVHFPIDERNRLVSLAVKRSPVPVLTGVGHSCLDGAVTLARAAADSGASGVLLMPPHFFRYGQDDVREFYLRFAELFKNAAPVFLYNIPQFTSPIALDTALELLATGEFAGIKDSSASREDFERLQAARAGHPFTLLVGHDILFTRARTGGADGIISGSAAAVPELLVALDRAITAGENDRAQLLERRLQEFLAWIDRVPTPVVIRQAAALRGLHVGAPASPPGPASLRVLDEFKEWFLGWIPAVLAECAQ
jgi:4-hydroxy-tetrahydrodipicolinate synthase